MGSTDFLFARPSFSGGMARSIDLFGVLQEYNKSSTTEEADAWALFNDFKMIGNDMTNAMKTISSEINK